MTDTSRQTPPWLAQTLRQAAALAGVPGLPADAILCVRRLRARVDVPRLRHAGGLLASADGLSRALRRHADAAKRPAREAVPDDAPAVLFADPGEMLACAARDWLAGSFAGRWWWRGLLDSGALAQGAPALWRRHPAHVPAALAALGPDAAAYAGRLSRAQAEALAAPVLALHALPGPPPTRPDWVPALPGLAGDDPRQRLLTLGLLLAHAPGLARVSQAWSDPGDELRAPSRQGAAPARHAAAPGRDRPAQMAPGTHATRAGHDGVADTPPRRHDADGWPAPRPERAPQVATAARGAPPAQGGHASKPTPGTRKTDQAVSARTAPTQPPPSMPRPGQPRHTPGPGSLPTLAPPPLSFAGETLDTRYGGVLYLLNLALHLDFYPDFTRPRDPGLALSPWDFLALAGERLAGRGLRHDPLWSLLARLADDGEHGPDGRAALAMAAPPPMPEALRPYATGRRGVAPPATWAAWLRWLMPPLRRRLAAALGVPPAQVGGLLCRQPARIRITTARLEACFALDRHPLAIRRAGLDRDPGWIPAAGRAVAFRYD